MDLRSLSASSARVYELCPARYRVEFEQRRGSASGEAANLGTACHHAMFKFVASDAYRTSLSPLDTICDLFDEKYWELFPDDMRRREGHKLVRKWATRQNWAGRTVLELETKKEILIPTSAGPVPFRYIMDRKDRHDDGEIEVIDYKSVSMPLPPEELRNRVQSRAYAWAAWKEHPEVKRVWVTFDLLRYEPISLAFTAEQCEEIGRYLSKLADRILADTEAPEVVNTECRFCPRTNECNEFAHYRDGRFKVAHMTPGDLLETRVKIDHVKSAIVAQLGELDEEITRVMHAGELEEMDAGPYIATLSVPRRREVNATELADLLPPEQFAKLAMIGVSGLDELLRSGELDDELASRVRQTMRWKHGKPTLKVKERR